ncbi:hypothetical protein CVT25_000301 [Psilocybe cyanescens]|uniref:Uncharacterized protein n=1 Tax=Psilocybe cyanescens TaxID=93625 RepID=A0A409XKE2_PSICY|nr:hypothetical protein CVT25_000301 [Psilocybe cyanescens]
MKIVHFFNDGPHSHAHPGCVLHPLPDEKLHFEELVQAHPKTRPLGLMADVPGVARPGESVIDISDVYLNADQVGKERLKIKKKAQTRGDDFMAGFSKFMAEHPGFVLNAQLGVVAVIMVQSKFMWSNLVKNSLLERLINRMVNDATHDWWEEHSALLMVMDFNNAEQNSFIMAFVEFWLFQEDNHQTRTQLKMDTEIFIKGCQEHFCTGVTYISCISGVVPPAQKDVFMS